MPKKKMSLEDLGSLVYSTDPDLTHEEAEPEETLSPNQQSLKVSKDKKQRRGKTVTLIEGFEGDENAMKALAKELKTLCGSGGGVKDGTILIQGDFVEKICGKLRSDGYHLRK